MAAGHGNQGEEFWNTIGDALGKLTNFGSMMQSAFTAISKHGGKTEGGSDADSMDQLAMTKSGSFIATSMRSTTIAPNVTVNAPAPPAAPSAPNAPHAPAAPHQP